jgi:hypothetical protein
MLGLWCSKGWSSSQENTPSLEVTNSQLSTKEFGCLLYCIFFDQSSCVQSSPESIEILERGTDRIGWAQDPSFFHSLWFNDVLILVPSSMCEKLVISVFLFPEPKEF